MCGRYSILPDAQAWADLGAVFGQVLAEQLNALPPRYNIAPTQTVPIIVESEDGTPVILDARWGLIPPWWKKPQPPPLTTNARSETAATKPMWREAWKKQRCLIPASSWYEWFNADEGKSKVAKIPHLIERADGKQILFAGLWSWSPSSPDAETVPTCAIVTVASAPDIAEIHERTPVVLNPEHWKAWIDRKLNDPNAVMQIVQEGAVEQFRMRTVSTVVGNARNSGPECLEPQLFPEMQRQGKAAYRKERLHWLRTTDAAELTRTLVQRLEEMAKGAALPVAERRLWVRELMDRDDADALGELVAEIRGTLRPVDSRPAARLKPDSGQSSLF